MPNKTNHGAKALSELREIHKQQPHISILGHVASALDIDLPELSDKELAYLLLKYKLEQELDVHPQVTPLKGSQGLDKIIYEGIHLDSILDEEEDV